MLRISQLKLPVEHSWEALEQKVRKVLRLKEDEAVQIQIIRRSVDARKKPELFFSYFIHAKVRNEKEVFRRCDRKLVAFYEEISYRFPVKEYKGKERPVIIGAGPAGLFCAYMLAGAGCCPILLERGKPVEERAKDVEAFWETGSLNPESNIQFGEGGAGTFSDGKLNTLVKDKYGRNRFVLSVFVSAGAPETILYDYKPHIGTDVLRLVIKNIRQSILKWGGEIRYEARVTEILKDRDRVLGVRINGQECIESKYVVLAPGHSARDTFEMLHNMGIRMEAKPFAVGMRVEHPQEMINLAQYGKKQEDTLGNAPYKLTAKASDGRGVYSFCMCPGGYVVNASSEPEGLVVNGMSYSKRDGKNANSAIIVSVAPEDYGTDHPLAGVFFQRRLEEKAYQLAEGSVPVERYGDYKKAVFMSRTQQSNEEAGIPEEFAPAVKGKWEFAPVHEILPEELQKAFVEGMEQFGRIIRGFNDDHALVAGIESRTSSPVRILRDKRLQASLKGLYPCGEGAGYAGGITSAAMDGILVAEEVALCMKDAYNKS